MVAWCAIVLCPLHFLQVSVPLWFLAKARMLLRFVQSSSLRMTQTIYTCLSFLNCCHYLSWFFGIWSNKHLDVTLDAEGASVKMGHEPKGPSTVPKAASSRHCSHLFVPRAQDFALEISLEWTHWLIPSHAAMQFNPYMGTHMYTHLEQPMNLVCITGRLPRQTCCRSMSGTLCDSAPGHQADMERAKNWLRSIWFSYIFLLKTFLSISQANQKMYSKYKYWIQLTNVKC